MSEPSAHRGCCDQHYTPPAGHTARINQSTDRENRDHGTTDQMHRHQDRHETAEHEWCAKQAGHQAAREYQQQPGGQRPRTAEFAIDLRVHDRHNAPRPQGVRLMKRLCVLTFAIACLVVLPMSARTRVLWQEQAAAAADISGFWELSFDSRHVPPANLLPAITRAKLDAHAKK